MTIEKLEKANEIVEELRNLMTELSWIKEIEEKLDKGDAFLRFSDNECTIELFDLDIKKKIVSILKDGVQNKINALKKTFEEL